MGEGFAVGGEVADMDGDTCELEADLQVLG